MREHSTQSEASFLSHKLRLGSEESSIGKFDLAMKIGAKSSFTRKISGTAIARSKSLSISQLNTATNWRKSWDIIVPGEFNGDGITDLLFYDRKAGTGEFYTTDGQGGLIKLSTATNWRKTWNMIIPGMFNGDGLTDLLFYDRNAGIGEFYTTDGQGGISGLGVDPNFSKNLDIIVAGNFDNSTPVDDLLFYDRKAGTVEFSVIESITVNDQRPLTKTIKVPSWSKNWDIITPGDFNADGTTDLLFYDRKAGTSKIYSTGGTRNLTEFEQGTHFNWREGWDQIISGNFNGDGIADLFFYDRKAKTGQFYTVDSTGKKQEFGLPISWQRSWDSIVPGNFGGDTLTDTLFYDRKAGRGEFYAGTNTPTMKWFNRNLKDAQLSNLTFSLMTDGFLSREEMIGILESTQNANRITRRELNDLRSIVKNLPMPDEVRVLAGKIVNGDPANARARIGNLRPNSRASQMEDLVDKWFRGLDNPDADDDSFVRYAPAAGQLFLSDSSGRRISYEDIDQGAVGNCYFMAALAATAYRAPKAIYNMFIPNSDGTFTVRFFRNGKADYVTVTPTLPVNSSGRFIYANVGKFNVLWGALAEKAYAQINESGWIGQNKKNSYEGIDAGRPYKAIQHITGDKAGKDKNSLLTTKISSGEIKKIINLFNRQQIITLNTKSKGVASNIASLHSYALINYFPETDKFTLFNPWGINGDTGEDRKFKPGIIELTRQQILKNFNSYDFSRNLSLWQDPNVIPTFIPI